MPRRTRATVTRTRRPRTAPVLITQQPHPKAWAHARALAKGDISRLRARPDGSVVVLNPPPD